MPQQVITSPDKESTVVIDRGELVRYTKNGEELIHQKGDPGWRNADTEMFPVIGPTAQNEYLVQTGRGEAVQDQHGLLRELAYSVVSKSDQDIHFSKAYEKHRLVRNSKFPEKSAKEMLFWPYSFRFHKRFLLTDDALSIVFEVEGEPNMPYMLGYHPAFKLSGEQTEKLVTKSKSINLQEILDVGSIAYPVLNTDEISLCKPNGTIKVTTKGFDHFMLWTEVPNMLCIEPITAYPYVSGKMLGSSLFKTCKGMDTYEVIIEPIQ